MHGIALMFTSVSGKLFNKRWIAVAGVLLVVGFLQTPWGLTIVARWVLHASDMEVQFDSFHGFWMHSLEVRGVEGKIDNHHLLVDTVRIQLSVGSLLRGDLHFRTVDVINPEFHLRPSETQDFLESDAIDETQVSLPTIDMIHVTGGRLIYDSQRLDIDEIHGQAISSANEVALYSIIANVVWKDEKFILEADAYYKPHQGYLEVDTLTLTGTESRILVQGQVGLNTNLHITADPLSSDIMGALGLTMDERFDVTTQLHGMEDSLHVAVDAASVYGQHLTLRATTTIKHPSLQIDTLDFENLDLMNVSPSLPAILSGSINGRVSGVTWNSLDGAITADLKESLLADIPIPSARLFVHLDQGDIHVDFLSDSDTGSLELVGKVNSSSQSGEIQGHFRHLDIQVLFPEHTSVLNGNINIGWGDSLLADIQVLPGSLGHMNLQGGGFKFYADDQGLQMTAEIYSDSTLIELRADQDDAGLTSRLLINALDVGEVMNQDHISSEISLVAESTTNWPPDSVMISVDIQPSMWEQIPVSDGSLQVLMYGFDLYMDGSVELPSGSITLRGDMNFESRIPKWNLYQGQLHHLNLQDLGMEIWTDLNSNFQFKGVGFKDVQGQVVLDSSKINDEAIHQGLFSVDMTNAVAVVDSRLSIGSGGLESQVLISPFSEFLDIKIKHGIFHGINLGSLFAENSFSTHLNGHIDSLSWDKNGFASVTLDSSDVATINLSGSQFTIKTIGDALSVSGVIKKDAGFLDVREFVISPEQKIRAVGSFHNVSMADFGVPDSELNASFDIDLDGFDPRTMTICHALVNADRTRVGDVEFDRVRISTAMQDGVITLDQFDMQSNVGQLSGEGSVSLFHESSQSIELMGEITNSSLLSDWTGGVPVIGAETDTLWAQFSHQNDALRWRAGVATRPMEWKSTRLFHASGYVEGTLHNLKPQLKQAQITLKRFSVPNLSARHMQVDIKDQDDVLQYEVQVQIDDQRSLTMNGEVDLIAQTGILHSLDLYLEEEQWRLGVPAQILADEGIRIRYFVFESKNQEIIIDGIVNPEGEQRIGLNLFNVQMSPFTDLFGLPSLGGVVNADLFFHGPATSPMLKGSLDLLVDSKNQRIGSVNAQLDYRNLGLDIQSNFKHTDGSSLSFSGLVPLDLRLSKEGDPLFPDALMTLKADRFNLAWVTPFLAQEEISNVQGKLTAEVDIRGSMTNLSMQGQLNLAEGSAGLPQLGINPTEFEVDAVMHQDTIYVKQVSAKSGHGIAQGAGQLILGAPNQGHVKMAIEMSDFQVVDTAPYQADVSGSLAVDGTVIRPSLSGYLNMTSAVIRPEDVPVTLADGMINFTEEDLQMLEEYFNIRAGVWDTTTYSLIDALTMNISIGIPGTVRLHSLQSPEMTVFLSGSLQISKESYADQQLRGTVSIVPELSYLRQFGRRFDIQRGRVTFSGSATNPFFDLQARLEIPNQSGLETPVTIVLDASGEIQDSESLTFELRSEPVQLDRADMISYMATGRPAADAFQLGSSGALQTGSNLALQQLSSLVAGAAGAGLGLDVVQIDPETNGDITLTAGKYVSRKLFTSVKWPVTASSSTSINTVERNRELVMEYSLYPWLLARMRGETGAVGLSFLYQYTW